MLQARLYLAENSVVMHSSDRNWVSAGKIELIDPSDDAAGHFSSAIRKVAAKLSQEKDELWREFVILRSLRCTSAAAFVISPTGVLAPDFINGLNNFGCCNGNSYYALVMEKGAYDLGHYLRGERCIDTDTRKNLVRELVGIVASINNAWLCLERRETRKLRVCHT